MQTGEPDAEPAPTPLPAPTLAPTPLPAEDNIAMHAEGGHFERNLCATGFSFEDRDRDRAAGLALSEGQDGEGRTMFNSDGSLATYPPRDPNLAGSSTDVFCGEAEAHGETIDKGVATESGSEVSRSRSPGQHSQAAAYHDETTSESEDEAREAVPFRTAAELPWLHKQKETLGTLGKDTFRNKEYNAFIKEAGQAVSASIEQAEARAKPALTADFVVVFCVSTFKRTFQVKKAFPPSVALTWGQRANVVWSIVDFNDSTVTGSDYHSSMNWFYNNMALPIKQRHVWWWQAKEPWEYFDCALAKNTSHMAGGAAAMLLGFPKHRIYVVNVDGDNVLTGKFVQDAIHRGREELDSLPVSFCSVKDDAAASRKEAIASESFSGLLAHAGSHWHNKELGTFGRVGLPYILFLHSGGYDQDLKGMGVQDWDLLNRLALIGSVRVKKAEWVGFSVPNQEEKMVEILAETGKYRRAQQKELEDHAKMRFLSPELNQQFHGSFYELCKANSKIARSKQKKQSLVAYRRNLDKPHIGVDFEIPSIFRSVNENLERRYVPRNIVWLSSSGGTSPPGLTVKSRSGGTSQPGLTGVGQEKTVEQEASITVCSFGTRTLTQCTNNEHAQAMHDIMWPSKGWADRRLDYSLARNALTAAVPGKWTSIVFVDCRSLWEPWPKVAAGHVGLHEKLQLAYMQQLQQGAGEVANQARQWANPWNFKGYCGKVLICFFCNAGEHRSVAMAEVHAGYLDKHFPGRRTHEVLHLCRDYWRWKYCGGCMECTESSAIRAEAQSLWEELMASE